MNKQEILDVLDMSEEGQASWLCSYIYHNKKGEEYWHNFLNRHISLADLAFRLRDAVNPEVYCGTLILAYQNWKERITRDQPKDKLVAFDCWILVYMTPIDMIVAALIAKVT